MSRFIFAIAVLVATSCSAQNKADLGVDAGVLTDAMTTSDAPSSTDDATSSVDAALAPVAFGCDVGSSPVRATLAEAPADPHVTERNWQVLVAGLLGAVWLILSRRSFAESFLHTPKGKAVQAAVSGVLCGFVPAIQTGEFTTDMLVSGITGLAFTLVSIMSPSPKDSVAAAAPAEEEEEEEESEEAPAAAEPVPTPTPTPAPAPTPAPVEELKKPAPSKTRKNKKGRR